MTPAIRALREVGAEFEEFVFDYRQHPGANGAAEALGIDIHITAKTILFTTDSGAGVVVLMHGDREVSTKKLARELGVKSVDAATQREADRLTGYQFGGTSPLGMKTALTVYAQPTLADLEVIYVNAGSKGFIIAIAPSIVLDLAGAILADVAVD